MTAPEIDQADLLVERASGAGHAHLNRPRSATHSPTHVRRPRGHVDRARRGQRGAGRGAHRLRRQLHRRERPRRLRQLGEQAGSRPADEDAPVSRFQRAVLRARPLLVAAMDGRRSASAPPCCCTATWSTPRPAATADAVRGPGLVPEFASSLLLPNASGAAGGRAAAVRRPDPAERAHELGSSTRYCRRRGPALARRRPRRGLLAKPAGALALTRSLLRGYPDERINERSARESRTSPNALPARRQWPSCAGSCTVDVCSRVARFGYPDLPLPSQYGPVLLHRSTG